MEETLTFKFRYCVNGQPTGFRASKGMAGPDALTLGDITVPIETITQTLTRDNHLVLVLSDTSRYSGKKAKVLIEGNGLMLYVYKLPIEILKKYIDRHTSSHHTRLHREKLAVEGKAEQFHSFQCASCGATCNLSGFDSSMYVFCPYCESIFTGNGELVSDGGTYRVCEECGMFDRVRGYTEFYFYFLFVVYGFSSKRRHVCDNCANGIFWKTLFINLVFILGIFPAIWIKLKSLTGRDPNLKRLVRANALAARGRVDEAHAIYEELHDAFMGHPGLLHNEAIGYLAAGKGEEAGKLFEAALKVCSNYLPTIQLLDNMAKAAQQPETS